jgi:hypothetical protein
MNIVRKTRGYFLIVTGFLACPCHLPVTLPLLVALTAGTAIGAFLANNVWLIVAVSTIYFVGAIALGIRYVGQEEKVCAAPEAQTKPRTVSDAVGSTSVREV